MTRASKILDEASVAAIDEVYMQDFSNHEDVLSSHGFTKTGQLGGKPGETSKTIYHSRTKPGVRVELHSHPMYGKQYKVFKKGMEVNVQHPLGTGPRQDKIANPNHLDYAIKRAGLTNV